MGKPFFRSTNLLALCLVLSSTNAGAQAQMQPQTQTQTQTLTQAQALDYAKSLEQAIQKLQAKRYDEAINDASALIKSKPADPSGAYALRGEAKFMKQQIRAALHDLNFAIKINPKYEQAFSIRAVVKVKTGDLDGAKKDCIAAEQLNPTDATNLGNLAFCEYQLQDNVKAIADINRALEIDPHSERLLHFKDDFEHSRIINMMSVFMH